MLEDFVSFSVPEQNQLMPIINNSLNTMEQKGINKYKPIHRSKATIPSWLAVQSEQGKPLGQAITNGYLSKNDETYTQFVNWLGNLFKKKNINKSFYFDSQPPFPHFSSTNHMDWGFAVSSFLKK